MRYSRPKKRDYSGKNQSIMIYPFCSHSWCDILWKEGFRNTMGNSRSTGWNHWGYSRIKAYLPRNHRRLSEPSSDNEAKMISKASFCRDWLKEWNRISYMWFLWYSCANLSISQNCYGWQISSQTSETYITSRTQTNCPWYGENWQDNICLDAWKISWGLQRRFWGKNTWSQDTWIQTCSPETSQSIQLSYSGYWPIICLTAIHSDYQ